MENQDFFNASRHKVPRNCTIDLENRNYNCTGKGRPYNYMEWMVTIKPSKSDQYGERESNRKRGGRVKERERKIGRERGIDRQRERHTERQRERETETKRQRETETKRDRDKDRQRQREKGTRAGNLTTLSE